MVLINNLTIDEINAALLHLQRSQGEVVGGIKENTIQNISITNTSTGVDYSTQIERLEKNVENLQRVDEELKDKDREIIEKLDALGLIGIGIDNLDFDPTTRVLSIFTTNGEEYTTTLTSEEVSLTFDSTSNKLVFSMGEQTKEVTLPYINASEKGAANGVATLDATGRVPYSQLPESAMEFKGEWNADTNTPTLKDEHGTNGDFYICNVGGTANFGTSQNPRTITFYVNDRVIYQGNVAQWKRLPASEVRTVNGQSGDVTLNGTNVKYSDASNSPTLKDKIDTVEGYAKTQSDWGQTNTGAIDFIKNKPSLATVATSGSYNDLSNKPTIPAAQIQSDWSQSDTSVVDYIKNKPNLATVATSGSYNDLSNKPTIPAAQIQSDWTQTDSTKKDFIKNKIPIWITSGSADDNMSPVNVVESGNTRPVTSGGVYSSLAGISGMIGVYSVTMKDLNECYVGQEKPYLSTWLVLQSGGAIPNAPTGASNYFVICFQLVYYQNLRITQIAFENTGGNLNVGGVYKRQGYGTLGNIAFGNWVAV